VSETPERRRVVWRLLRSPAAWGVAVLGAAGLFLSGAGGVRWAQARALSATCDEVPSARPSLLQIVALSRRMRAYQEDVAPGARLAMTAGELTYLVGDRPDMHLAAAFEGGKVRAHLAITSEQGGCYNVVFRGSLSVDHGLATVVPERLVVGSLNVSSVVGGFAFQVRPEDVPDARLGSILQNTEELRVRGDRMTVGLRDRHSLR